MTDTEARNTFLPAPRYLLWELTLKCNCRCTHCAASGGHVRSEELSTEEALEVCGQIARLKVESVCLMGGEALLRPDWDLISLRLRELGVEALGIVTNGIALGDENWRKLEILGFRQVVVSLDAMRPEIHDGRRRRKGAHAAALRVIREMENRPLAHRTVVTALDKNTMEELPAIRDFFLADAPSVSWSISYACPTPESRMSQEDTVDDGDFLNLVRFVANTRKEHEGRLKISGNHSVGYFSQRYPHLHDYLWQGCQAGISTLGIRSDGAVVGCLIMSDPFVEGNVRETDLGDIWRDPNRFAYNRRFDVSMLHGKCAGCVHGEICRGGCRESGYAFNRNPFEPPFCLYQMEREGILEPAEK